MNENAMQRMPRRPSSRGASAANRTPSRIGARLRKATWFVGGGLVAKLTLGWLDAAYPSLATTSAKLWLMSSCFGFAAISIARHHLGTRREFVTNRRLP